MIIDYCVSTWTIELFQFLFLVVIFLNKQMNSTFKYQNDIATITIIIIILFIILHNMTIVTILYSTIFALYSIHTFALFHIVFFSFLSLSVHLLYYFTPLREMSLELLILLTIDNCAIVFVRKDHYRSSCCVLLMIPMFSLSLSLSLSFSLRIELFKGYLNISSF